MYGVSKKEIMNKPTILYRKDNSVSFMNLSNQRLLTKKIYIMHKNNNGLLQYLYFKEIVPVRMQEWINKKNINSLKTLRSGSLDMIDYLNKLFINDNNDLYALTGYEYQHMDSNVYRTKLSIQHEHDAPVVQKCPKEMLLDDIRNMDVWAKQTIEVSNKNKRYNNAIVPWQASMHKRNYDLSNQGYKHADPNRASLENSIYGYGDDIKRLYKKIDAQLKNSK